jgi:AbiV family abortive infection protein
MTAREEFAFVDLNVAKHRGPLSPIDMGRGVLATHRNARRLFLDAMLLLEYGRYPTALSTAILAHEEAAKHLAIGFASVIDFSPSPMSVLGNPKLRKQLVRAVWKEFESHTHKNRATLDLHRIAGDFKPEVRSTLEASARDMADTYVALRGRGTYVDSVHGPERWSTPDKVIDRELATTMMVSIRRSMQRIVTAAQIAGSHAARATTAGLDAHRAAALKDWAESAEAEQLSQLDRAEQAAWIHDVDEIFTRLGVQVKLDPPDAQGIT